MATGPDSMRSKPRYQTYPIEGFEDDLRINSNQAKDNYSRGPRAFGNQRVYEAFNDLHALAQKFEKPFDAPAILVVGHQTDGKSALVEALIGLQFNDVGGGTKTRRPLALHMRFNPSCHQPLCLLVKDDMSEQEMSLPELQAYIQEENARLQAGEQFSNREIIVKVEYKYSPNLTIIDTPGLISAPPGKAHAGLQAAARTIEAMVSAKAATPELILLCLEDCNDWTHATTRKLVMQADPTLARTVLVSTKFDTRIATFSRPADIDGFIQPACLGAYAPLSGAPFFTSVPAGRVGNDSDCVFTSNEGFRQAVADREAADVCSVEAKLQRKLEKEERSHIGVGALRGFLEGLLQQKYLEHVPHIMPLLEREHTTAQQRLAAAHAQLSVLNHADLKEKGRQLTDGFLVGLSSVLRGNAGAPPDKYGETLSDEHLHTGAFLLPGSQPAVIPEALDNAGMRLYGGAQFYRAMAEFRMAVGQTACPEVTREEVANACGLEDAHDGANYMRAACVIAVAKARAVFEPCIHQLAKRLSHVLRRMLPPTLHMLEQGGVPGVVSPAGNPCNEALSKLLSNAFTEFVDEVAQSCTSRCLEDLQSTTRYVSWSLHTRGGQSMRSMLSRVKLPGLGSPDMANGKAAAHGKADNNNTSYPQAAVGTALSDLLEQILFSRQLSSTSQELVNALVAQMFEGVRDFVVQAAELKFNCFLLMPIVDIFPARLRAHMEAMYETDLDTVFHTRRTRNHLETTAQTLATELHQVERLLRKFSSIQSTLTGQQASIANSMVATQSTAGTLTASTNVAPPAPEPSMTPTVKLQGTINTAVAPPSNLARVESVGRYQQQPPTAGSGSPALNPPGLRPKTSLPGPRLVNDADSLKDTHIKAVQQLKPTPSATQLQSLTGQGPLTAGMLTIEQKNRAQ